MQARLQQLLSLTAPELFQEARRIRLRLAESEWAMSVCLLALERSDLHRQEGCSSAVQYAVRHLELDGHKAAELLRTARALESLPEISEAFRLGKLGWGRVRELTRVVRPETEKAWLTFALEHFTEQVQRQIALSPREWKKATLEAHRAATAPELFAVHPGPANEGTEGPDLNLRAADTPGSGPSLEAHTPAPERAHSPGSAAAARSSGARAVAGNPGTQAATRSPGAWAVADNPDPQASAENSAPQAPARSSPAEALQSNAPAEALQSNAPAEALQSNAPAEARQSNASAEARLSNLSAEVRQSKAPADARHCQASGVQQALEGLSASPPGAPPRPAPLPGPKLIKVELYFTPEQYAVWEQSERIVRNKHKKSMRRNEVAMELARAVQHSASSQVRARHQVVVHVDAKTGQGWYETDRGVLLTSTEQVEEAMEEGEVSVCDGRVANPAEPPRSSRGKRSRYISVGTVRALHARAGGKCEVPGCGRSRSLHVHHLLPFSQGGGNELEGLQLRCLACHSLGHQQDYENKPAWRAARERKMRNRKGARG